MGEKGEGYLPENAPEHIARGEYLGFYDSQVRGIEYQLSKYLPEDHATRLNQDNLLRHLRPAPSNTDPKIVQLFTQVFASGDLSRGNLDKNLNIGRTLAPDEAEYMQKLIRTLGILSFPVVVDVGIPQHNWLGMRKDQDKPGPMGVLTTSLGGLRDVPSRLMDILNIRRDDASHSGSWETITTRLWGRSRDEGNLDTDVKQMILLMKRHEGNGHQAFGIFEGLVSMYRKIQKPQKGEQVNMQSLQSIEKYMWRMLQLVYDPIVGEPEKQAVQRETPGFEIPQDVKPKLLVVATYTSIYKPDHPSEYKELIGEQKLPINAVRTRFEEIFLTPHETAGDLKRLFHMESASLNDSQIARLKTIVRLAEAVVLYNVEEPREESKSTRRRQSFDMDALPVAMPGSGMHVSKAQEEQPKGPESYNDFLHTIADARPFDMFQYLTELPESMDTLIGVKGKGEETVTAAYSYRDIFSAIVHNLEKLETGTKYDMCGVARQLLDQLAVYKPPPENSKDILAYSLPYLMRLAVNLVDDPEIFGRVFPDY